MTRAPEPPRTFKQFIERFPTLAEAWERTAEAGREGPLDDKTGRLIKLAVAAGAMRQGAVRSSVRKALALGASAAEIEQVVALAAGTLGLPSTVAVWSWIRETEGWPEDAPSPEA